MIIWYLSMLFLDVPWYTMVLFPAPFNWIGKLVYIWTVVGKVNISMCFFCNTDVNECATSPCDANAACANTAGSYTCTCNSGYTGNGTSCTGKKFYCLIIW